MVVTFTLLPDIKWSDGNPLTATDSVYSYQVAADAATLVSKTQIKKTLIYEALNDQEIVWTGIPGYLTLNPSAYFWIPLPKHQLDKYSAEELNTASETNRKPIGWGPYMLDEWKSGEQIRLVKNPNYFRAAEGLPYYDSITYKFLGNVPVADISPVVNGECDIIDTSVSMSDQWNTIRDLELKNKVKGYFGQGPEWEGLNFGIKPNSYDAVFNPSLDRPNYFGDVRTRQAIAQCIDRDAIVTKLVFSLGEVPDSFLTTDHPFHVGGLTTYTYDPEKGKQLLEEIGWKDKDGDPTTPRVAKGVESVYDGTPFEITYTGTNTPLHQQVASRVQSDLQACGIKVKSDLKSVGEVYAAGPEGIVFGRNFDMAEFGWTTGKQPPCFLYASSEIPSAANDWLGSKYGGLNITGFSNEAYDQACALEYSSGLDQVSITAANAEAMKILADEIPVLPLFYHIKVMVSRPDLCGLSLDVSARSGLKDVESLKTGAECMAN